MPVVHELMIALNPTSVPVLDVVLITAPSGRRFQGSLIFDVTAPDFQWGLLVPDELIREGEQGAIVAGLAKIAEKQQELIDLIQTVARVPDAASASGTDTGTARETPLLEMIDRADDGER